MRRHLLDDNLISEIGNKCETILEVPETQPPEAGIKDPRVLAMELSCKPIQVEGYRLVEEEILPGGQRLVRQEYSLAPDIAYALFDFFKSADKQAFPDENTQN